MGNYAVRMRFDDGHDSGLYSWDYLHKLGANEPQKWAAYLSALRAKRTLTLIFCGRMRARVRRLGELL